MIISKVAGYSRQKFLKVPPQTSKLSFGINLKQEQDAAKYLYKSISRDEKLIFEKINTQPLSSLAIIAKEGLRGIKKANIRDWFNKIIIPNTPNKCIEKDQLPIFKMVQKIAIDEKHPEIAEVIEEILFKNSPAA